MLKRNLQRDSEVLTVHMEPPVTRLLTSMIHIPNTYDEYRCPDCNIILSGYKRGDPRLDEHIFRGKGQCQYLKQKFRGRENDLTVLYGRVRFQRGLLAFPQYILDSECGYVKLSETAYCIVCASPMGEKHNAYEACQDMTSRFLTNLKHLKLHSVINKTRLFYIEPSYFDDLETDSAVVPQTPCFNSLGDFAGMYYVDGTVDTHTCYTCDLSLKHFSENDTLLGEHVYHSYNHGKTCDAIETRFKDRRYELECLLGEERVRRGFIAFPGNLLRSTYGYTNNLGGVNRCVMCSAIVIQGLYLPNLGHGSNCAAMKQSLGDKIRDMRLLI